MKTLRNKKGTKNLVQKPAEIFLSQEKPMNILQLLLNILNREKPIKKMTPAAMKLLRHKKIK